MKIDNFVRIIDGKLRTSPPIDAFASVQFDLARLSHGDLFIDLSASRETIHLALSKGAYAVVTTLPYHNDDDESAWIEVEHIDTALIKLLRYTITQKSLVIILCSPLQAALLSEIHTPKTLKRLQGDLSSMAKTLLGAKDEEQFFLEDATLTGQIAPSALEVKQTLHVSFFTQAKGLFLSTFEWQGRHWSDQKLPLHFVEPLLALLSFCDEHAFSYSLETLGFCEHFYPQFVTPSLVKKEFGCSAQTLIFERNPALLEKHILHLQAHTNDFLLCLPRTFVLSQSSAIRLIVFDNFEHLATLLTDTHFTYALIYADQEAFEPFYRTPSLSQPTLF